MTPAGAAAATGGRGGRAHALIAIDGPGGAGKSTLAASLARHLRCGHLDTGAMYRAVTLAALRRDIDTRDAATLTELARTLDIDAGPPVLLDGEDVTDAIRSSEVDGAVSEVSSHRDLRTIMVTRQRAWARVHGGGVVEGRDIGSVVFPDAALKVFLTAGGEERARRRVAAGPAAGDAARESLDRRDTIDSSREASPLVVPSGAVVIDSSEMSAEEVLAEVLAHLASPPGPKDPGYTLNYRMMRNLAVGIAKLYFRIRVHHIERVPASGGFILAPVHRSNLDFLMAAAVVRRRKLHYMTKEEVWKSRLLGRLVQAYGGFPVHRSIPDREALRRAQEVVDGGGVLILFPEGMRRAGPNVEDLHEGASYIALRAGVPIVPVGIAGSDLAMPKGSRLARPVPVDLVVGVPIAPRPVTAAGRVPRSAVKQVTEEVRAGLEDVLAAAQEAQRSRHHVRRMTRA